jgi:hypothetical protein
VSVAYSGGVYYNIGCDPASNATTASVDSDSAVKRIGNRLILPVPVTAIGIWCFGDIDQDTTTLKLYGTDGTTVLATSTLSSVKRGSTGVGHYVGFFDSGATVELSANTASAYKNVSKPNTLLQSYVGNTIASTCATCSM